MIVTVNDKRYISEELIITALASIYYRSSDNKVWIAKMCDDIIDPTGRLLGRVREKSIKISKLDIS